VPSILVGTADRTVLVRVEGKGTFLNSTGLKEFAKEMTNRGFREFIVDLKNCPVMDSTFMGILAFVAMRLRKLGSGEMRAINLNERNRDLLCNLGLDQLFTISEVDETSHAPQPLPLPLPMDATDKRTQKQTMLEAHEAVIEANPANAAKFKDVLEFLKQDISPAR
jgi:anti-sigma B factor antagonist